MNTRTRYKIALSLVLGGTLGVASNSVMAVVSQSPVQVSQTPLSTGTAGALPNIMLMIDNSGSMSTKFTPPSSPQSPKDMPTGTTYSCTNPVIGGTATNPSVVGMIVTGATTGTAKLCVSSKVKSITYPCGGTPVSFSSPLKCFENSNDKYYDVQNYVTTTSLSGTSLTGGPFTGAQLNWYFSTSTFVAGSLDGMTSPAPTTRMAIAKEAARNLVAAQVPKAGNSATVRLGLTTFSGNTGGNLLVEMGDITSDATSATSQAKKITDAIGTTDDSGSIKPTGYTPLAETLADIGRYFCRVSTPPSAISSTPANDTSTMLTIGSSTASVADIFGTSRTATPADLTNNNNGLANVTTATLAPITSYCQKNAVILVTDGLPNKDREISRYLRNYKGECAATTAGVTSASLCDATPTSEDNSDLPGGALTETSGSCKPDKNNIACKNGTKRNRVYETIGSDYLDDVANALFDMDLRPDLKLKNNLITFAIGIGDPAIKAQVDSPAGSVLKDATGDWGAFEYADNYAALKTALDNMVANIKKGVGSFSAIVANTTQLTADAAVFQAKYDTTDWTGDFLALPLDATGAVQAAVWNAGEKIPDWNSRNIYTYNAAVKGFAFNRANCSNLTASQQSALGINASACASATTDTTDQGLWRLDYLRGDISHEQAVSLLHKPTYTTDPRLTNNTATNRIFRTRARFYGPDITGHAEGTLVTPDPWLLGDIVNSDAVYVSNETYGYNLLAGLNTAEKDSYAAFVTSKNNWLKMVYIGANDGMLHGFNACIPTTASCTDAGKEIIAYLPNSIYGGLKNLSNPNYAHQFFVDGSPKVSDVYFNNTWHTVLVGTTGAGGHGVFALDVTNPNTFSASNILWEISDTPANPLAPTTDEAEFAANLGYTLPQASIGKMQDGSWAAIVANGYVSAGTGNPKIQDAKLYIINIQTGAIIATLATNSGTSIAANGLSTPIAVDVDTDGIIDAVYAGDLLGNMWKFDVSDKLPSKWKVAYGTAASPAPLFIACNDINNCDTTRQAITNKPQVGKVSKGQTPNTSVMVYFGTGKYFEESDNDTVNAKTQSYYGIWDECPLTSFATTGGSATVCTTVPKSALIQQSITAELPIPPAEPSVRLTSNTASNYPTKKGWFIDFFNVNSATKENFGERIVSASLLRGGRIIFATLIPVPPVTSSTVDVCALNSTSWLMELDALSGSRVSTPVLDINNNGTVDLADTVNDMPVSGIKMTEGSTKTPAVITNPGHDEIKYTGSSKGAAPKGIAEKPPSTEAAEAGRQAWRQL